ncbi:MAG: hypothetical protein AAFU71_09515 [Cyanobacteria bacterium J06632_22]
MTLKSSAPDPSTDHFWHNLSQEFAFDQQGDGQMEQQLRAITETWMICTSELFGLPVQTTLSHGARHGARHDARRRPATQPGGAI